MLRGESDRSLVPAAPGALATLVRNLPSGSAVDQGAPAQAATYLELLSRVLEDGTLTDVEARALIETATLYSLTREQVAAAHRAFLLAMAHRAVQDGTVTRDERAALLDMASTLGADTGVISDVLDEAYQDHLAERSAGLRPLPEGWRLGEPLRVGDRVVFTGCDDLERLRLEGAARAAGLRVTSAVSRLTAVLVTAAWAPVWSIRAPSPDCSTTSNRPDSVRPGMADLRTEQTRTRAVWTWPERTREWWCTSGVGLVRGDVARSGR